MKTFSYFEWRKQLRSVEKSFKTLNILAEKFDICSKQYELVIVFYINKKLIKNQRWINFRQSEIRNSKQ
jgi:hypothetical protein